MNAAYFRLRAKPLIITRFCHVVGNHRHSVGIASARHLAQGSAATPPKPSQSPPPPGPPSSSPPSQRAQSSSRTAAASTTSQPGNKTADEGSDLTAKKAAASSSTPNSASGAGAQSCSSASTGAAGPEASSRSSSWLWRTIYLTAGVGSAALAAQYAYDPVPVKSAAQALYDTVDARVRYFAEPSREKLLPDAVSPYPNMAPPRTLVIDLDDTLVHSTYSRVAGWRVAKRPGAEAFLAYLASFYEIVVFTSKMATYADPILNRLDPNSYVMHRLYRAETHYQQGVHIKDVSRMNRPLERVIVIDHDEKCVCLQPDNAIIVPEWKGDPSDTALLDLIPLLEGVVREDIEDVRDILRDLQGKSVADAVVEYRAMAAARAERARTASMFGHLRESGSGSSSASARIALSKDDDSVDDPSSLDSNSSASTRRGVWGSMRGRSKLFQSRGATNSEEK